MPHGLRRHPGKGGALEEAKSSCVHAEGSNLPRLGDNLERTSVLIMQYSDSRLELEAASVCLEIETISGECEV
jgi:hypothetical protein